MVNMIRSRFSQCAWSESHRESWLHRAPLKPLYRVETPRFKLEQTLEDEARGSSLCILMSKYFRFQQKVFGLCTCRYPDCSYSREIWQTSQCLRHLIEANGSQQSCNSVVAENRTKIEIRFARHRCQCHWDNEAIHHACLGQLPRPYPLRKAIDKQSFEIGIFVA